MKWFIIKEDLIMANNANLVTAGKPKVGGAVFTAPLGTSLPTSAVTALDESVWTGLGYISDSGVVNSNSPSNTSIKAWGGDTVLDIQTEKPDTWKMTLIEHTNKDVLKFIYGDGNVTGSLETGIVVQANSNELTTKSMIIDMILKNGTAKRVVLPNCKVTSVSDVNYTDSDAVGYEVEISAYPDSNGNTHYEYIIAQATPTM